jgi:hypothetical protein
MLVTFESKAYANITMFGDVAKKLIKYMGHSGTIPSAIKSADIPLALKNLKHAVQTELQVEPIRRSDKNKNNLEDDDYVTVDKRAKPLIEMLEAAITRGEDVVWYSE